MGEGKEMRDKSHGSKETGGEVRLVYRGNLCVQLRIQVAHWLVTVLVLISPLKSHLS